MGILKNFLTSGRRSKPTDLSVLISDVHSHLIPGLDDGADTLSTSVELLKGLIDIGYQKVITTPHIQGEFYTNTPSGIRQGLEQLKREVKKQSLNIDIEAAAEYLLDDKFEAKYKSGPLMTFGKKHLLVEFSYFNEHPNWKKFLFDLQIEGYKIILAHPERYSYWFRNFDKYRELKHRGILFQLNIISLTGYYSPEVKRMAEKLIDENMIDLVGSDMHNLIYLEALQKSRYEPYLDKLITSGKLLNPGL